MTNHDPRDPLGLLTPQMVADALEHIPTAYGSQPGEMDAAARGAILSTGLPLRVAKLEKVRAAAAALTMINDRAGRYSPESFSATLDLRLALKEANE